MNNSPASQNLDDQSEISLIGIVYFLQSAWKKLAISAVVGAVLGLGGWFVLGSYSAKYVLLNNNRYALDLVSWKRLQKSLPNLADQIIAANNDLNGSKEALTRLQKSLDQLALTKTFLEQSLPLRDQTLDGLKLNQQLLEIESSLRAKLSKDDSNGADFLNALQAQPLAIQVRFSKGLEANTAPTASHKGMIKATAAGFAAAFFLMLMFLLGQKAWTSAEEQDAKAVQ